ncbi:C-GCAxxG-C-C family protein [Clostridium aminobutyricum]|uniref:C_GCAxxG_C_C family protein n=1 Tax=Clostridium aminobutyricum TaxID=33953 RepID=A0A939DAA2_CLOAM|nr:C-GCAxxG-C-C family protein [Clostridium aminobutyricum]MBN7774279.1 C_GCAxxG_C_C family protein [Clostridium aminobutyricum]
MSKRVEQAVANHKKGYNCAQSVACAYCDLFGIDEQTAFRLAESYGLGMGTMGTCGAVTAMAMINGMKNSDGNLEAPATKKTTYANMKKMTQEFFDKNGSIMCNEIKGMTGGEVLRTCDGCIEDAAHIIEEILLSEKSEE